VEGVVGGGGGTTGGADDETRCSYVSHQKSELSHFLTAFLTENGILVFILIFKHGIIMCHKRISH